MTDIFELSKLVGRIIPGTEEQFLLIGSRLNKVYTDVENVSRQASELVGLLDSSAMKGTISRFRDVISQLEDYIGKFHQRFESGYTALKDVGNAVSDVAAPMANFRKIVKKLKILGISTKIESAQLKKMEIDFVNLAGDVEQLSELIQDKSTAIEKHRASLMALATGTLSKISGISQKSKGFTDAALADINSSIALLESRNEQSFGTADSILGRSHATSAQVGEVVMSMQFHDITRQQIEHIVDVLENLEKKYASGVHAVGDTGDEPPAAVSGVLAEAVVVCELQKAQLVDAQDKFMKAVRVIMDNLRGISTNVFKIIDDIQKITGTTDFSSDNFLSDIESGTAAVMDKVDNGAKAEAEFVDAMGELSEAVSTISELVDDIEEIGQEIELIAINARVKAARTGEEGAPLGVIAEAIWHLSLDATSQKSVISDLLKKVVVATQGLQSAAVHDHSGSENSNTITELSDIIDELKRMKDEVARLVGQIESGSRSLADLVEDTIHDITVHDDLERDVKDVCLVFDEFITEVRQKVSPAEIDEARRQSFEYIQNNYTMQRERTIHHKVASNVVPIDSRKKEMVFEPPMDNEGSGSDELGDNVELF